MNERRVSSIYKRYHLVYYAFRQQTHTHKNRRERYSLKRAKPSAARVAAIGNHARRVAARDATDPREAPRNIGTDANPAVALSSHGALNARATV